MDNLDTVEVTKQESLESAPGVNLPIVQRAYNAPPDSLDWVASPTREALAASPLQALVQNPPDWVFDRRISGGSEGYSAEAKQPDAASSAAAAAAGAGSGTRGRVQVLLDDGWHDSPFDEAKQICSSIAGGLSKFTVSSQRGMYIIDLTGPDGATQTNAATKKSRSLRILEENVDTQKTPRFTVTPSSPSMATPTSTAQRSSQLKYGPQSKRGNAPQHQLEVIERDPHAVKCFETLAKNEEELCGEWAVFYHSYSCAALIYEVHAAVASVLFGFDSGRSPLPRLLVNDFAKTPDAASLVKRFKAEFRSQKKDHEPEYRKVAISAMCSLVALGPEASTPIVFMFGYSEKDVSFRGVLENLLESCHVPKNKIKKLAQNVIALCEKHGLDASQFGGKKCSSGKPGHLLQIFIKRRILDDLAYAAKPYGSVDEARHPISEWLNADSNTNYGQARIVAHPKSFLSDKCVQMHVVSADPTFHSNRQRFQVELAQLFMGVLGDSATRERVATALYGGVLPARWRDGELGVDKTDRRKQ